MKVTITDHRHAGIPFVIDGDPLQVEETIRKEFRDCVSHVPTGDLVGLLDALSNSSFLTVTIGGYKPLRTTSPAPKIKERYDPWIRECDIPIPGRNL